ncbi:MAG: glutamine synthetase, partial [Bacteroidales bacterium]|nr:glutamine synthetase [Bacteroidales bacterium]
MDNPYSYSSNPLERYLGKPASDFTRQDLLRFISGNEIKMMNFRYVAEDGKLKVLNFVLHSLEYADAVLSSGERVDGSSLFSYIEAGSSD